MFSHACVTHSVHRGDPASEGDDLPSDGVLHFGGSAFKGGLPSGGGVLHLRGSAL